jgi:hypothetical protein
LNFYFKVCRVFGDSVNLRYLRRYIEPKPPVHPRWRVPPTPPLGRVALRLHRPYASPTNSATIAAIDIDARDLATRLAQTARATRATRATRSAARPLREKALLVLHSADAVFATIGSVFASPCIRVPSRDQNILDSHARLSNSPRRIIVLASPTYLKPHSRFSRSRA